MLHARMLPAAVILYDSYSNWMPRLLKGSLQLLGKMLLNPAWVPTTPEALLSVTQTRCSCGAHRNDDGNRLG